MSKKHTQQHVYSRRLLILLGISLLAHGLLLIHWPASKPVLEFDYQPQNLALNLKPIEVIGQQQQAKKNTVNKQKPAPKKQPDAESGKHLTKTHSTQKMQAVQETSSSRDISRNKHQQAASENTHPSMNRAQVLSQIRHDLSQYFYYPPHARRKGMQGTVLLSFGISGQGNVHDIRIVKSSGYAILDLAAQDAMQRLHKLSWYAALMHGKDMDLELPVIFRLTEG